MNSKKFTPELALELENLINNTIDKSFLPYVKGKSIRIGHVIVRETRVGFFLVFDTKENTEIAKMFCKTGAVALAKSIVSKQNDAEIKIIKSLDDIISKNFNDAIFYKHTIKVTKDDIKKQVAQMRYSVARDATQHAKDKLDTFIYY
jgi:hypothetical protein